MYHPTTRLLTVLELLQAHARLSGAELARRLEVDPRTIRRYVTMLQDLGIPVEAERGRHGGYRLRPGYKLPPLLFTEEEALAVTLGLLSARRLGLAAAAPAVEGALAKVERVLPETVRERVRAMQDTIGFTLPAVEPAPADSATLATLGTAAQRSRRVWLRYRSWRGEESERLVDPYGLVFHRGRWYLAGHDHRRGGVRVFRVDRVLVAEVREEPFERPDGFDPVAHVQRSLAGVPWGWEVEVMLETTLAEARQRVPSTVAVLAEGDGGVVLRAQASDLGAAARSLVALGWRFTVRRPPELRDALRRLAVEIASLADE